MFMNMYVIRNPLENRHMDDKRYCRFVDENFPDGQANSNIKVQIKI